jgi:hypothetical protein
VTSAPRTRKDEEMSENTGGCTHGSYAWECSSCQRAATMRSLLERAERAEDDLATLRAEVERLTRELAEANEAADLERDERTAHWATLSRAEKAEAARDRAISSHDHVLAMYREAHAEIAHWRTLVERALELDANGGDMRRVLRAALAPPLVRPKNRSGIVIGGDPAETSDVSPPPLDMSWADEDPGTCFVCGKPWQLVRPGKSQPNCRCDEAHGTGDISKPKKGQGT